MSLYIILLVAVILLSAVPLMCKGRYPWFRWAEILAAAFFLLDHILRWSTADYKQRHAVCRPFLRYPFLNMALIVFNAEPETFGAFFAAIY